LTGGIFSTLAFILGKLFLRSQKGKNNAVWFFLKAISKNPKGRYLKNYRLTEQLTRLLTRHRTLPHSAKLVEENIDFLRTHHFETNVFFL